MKAISFSANMSTVSVKEGMASFRLRVLQEPNQEELYNLTQLQQKELEVVMQPLEGASETIKMESTKDLKSPSERLRGAIYADWASNKVETPFEDYYRKVMEAYIEHRKSKIREE